MSTPDGKQGTSIFGDSKTIFLKIGRTKNNEEYQINNLQLININILKEFGVAMGIKRGQCQESGCNCSRYKAVEDDEEGGGNCVNCGHFPGNHENLGMNTSEEGKVYYADSDPLGLLSEV